MDNSGISSPVQQPAPVQPAPQPVPPSHVKKAHSFLIVYILIVLAAILSGGIYAWQNSKVKDLKNQVAKAASQVSDLKKDLAAAEAALPANTNYGDAPNNPYAGWKTFCDNISSVCLRYPKDWNITGDTTERKTTESFTDPKGTVVVNYDNPYAADTQEQVYYIADVLDLRIKTLGPRIVARVIGSSPDYVTVDSSYVVSTHAAKGQTISFINNARFKTNVKDVTARLKAGPTGATLSSIKTAEQAIAWFNSESAKTALKILQSLYYQ